MNGSDNIKLLLVVLVFSFCFFFETNAQVIINEVSASNHALPYDDNMDSPDWIELYNMGTEPVNLQNYHISDQNEISLAWRFPNVIIQPNDYLLLFASGKDNVYKDKLILEASGHGITNLETRDEFRFEYFRYKGDFDLSMRVHSFTNTPLYATIGLVLRNDLTDSAAMIGMFCRQKEQRYFAAYIREEINTLLKESHTRIKPDYPNCRIQIKKVADTIYTNVIDKELYVLESLATYFPTNNSFYIGLGISSADNKLTSKAVLSDIKFNGDFLTADDFNTNEYNLPEEGKKYYTYELHTDFRLSRESENIYLFAPDGKLADRVEYNNLRVNVSFGRLPDGSLDFKYFEKPTPNFENTNGKDFICKAPEFSLEGGFFDSAQELQLTAFEQGTKIHFTLDGSEPTTNSDLYLSPIIIDKNTVVRAISVNEFGVESADKTHTFFIGQDEELPVFSLSSDPYLLFSEDEGLFHNDNLWPSRQIPLHFELWDNAKLEYSAYVEARLHGQVTRTYAQKSIRFYARNEFNTPEFKFMFFGDRSQKKYEHILLRNGGSDWNEARIRDAFCNVLSQHFEHLIACEYRPIVAYINGEYWGLYNLRERINEDYLAQRFDISEESINLMEQFDFLITGSSKSYYAIFDTLKYLDMSEDASVQVVSNLIDLNNITEYTIFNSFLGNFDWPFNNIKFFNSSELDGKWRWVNYDMDYTNGLWGTGPYNNVLERALDIDTSDFAVIMQSLLENENFRLNFINRFADLMNTKLKYKFTVQIFDSLVREVENEVLRHQTKWPESMRKWDIRTTKIRKFLNDKAEFERGYIVDQFDLLGDYKLILSTNIPNAAYFEINSIVSDTLPWDGYYFTGVPIRIKIKPKYGMKFLAWSDPKYGDAEEIIVNSNEDLILTAIFEDIADDRKIVINEFMYNASDNADSKDWIEILNYGDENIDISSWVISDNNDEHRFVIPNETELSAGEILIFCRDSDAFQAIHSNVVNVIGNIDFGFGSEDGIRLFDDKDELVDYVEYTSEVPWYPEADGTGPSLELIDPDYDNALSTSWRLSEILGGTPGEKNSVGSIISKFQTNYEIFPNPAKDYVTIRTDDLNSLHSFVITDAKGTIVMSDQKTDESGILIDLKSLSSGVYYLKVIGNDGETVVLPLTILR